LIMNRVTNTIPTTVFFICFIVLVVATGFMLVLVLTLIFLLTLGLTYLVREVIMNKRLPVPEKAAILITGAGAGIGASIAVHLANLGFLVIAAVRKDEDGKKLQDQVQDKNKVFPVIMDVTSMDQIKAAADAVSKRLQQDDSRLFAIINNAGYGENCPLELAPIDKIRRQYEVNVFGQVAVTQAFLPLLRKNGYPERSNRIIFMSSLAGRLVFPNMAIYCSSKAALESIADGFRMELHHWNIDVSVIEPGIIKTAFRAVSVKAGEDNLKECKATMMCSESNYNDYVQMCDKFAKARAQNLGVDVAILNYVVEDAVLSSKPMSRYMVGKEASAMPMLKRLPDKIKDRMLGGAFR